MHKTLLKLFLNPATASGGEPRLAEAYAQQWKFLKKVWNEENYGLERLVRLFLCAIQFLYPVLLIRDIFGRWGSRGRRLAVEVYAVLKFFFPLAVLFTRGYQSPAVIFLVVYLMSDTLVHILHLIFLADVHSAAISYRRSLVLIFLHYAEIAFGFAVIYRAYDLLSRPVDAIGALYFSIVATTTVGFGDITARDHAGQVVVMAQLMVCVLFVVIFINYFSQKLNEK
ncbi:MAG TPA: potassium channel family protein [Candidatus Omnitrophota bacterium]|nr:potassium channel family protein [Candidatus Omnitrophota bacterium]